MAKYQNKYRIESNRYQYWDYSWPGDYFITICTKNRECFLGKIINKKMVLSPYGEIVENEILNIPEYHEQVQLGEWVIMPNHVHMIINIIDKDKIHGLEEKIHEFSLRQRQQPQCPWWHNPDHQPTIDEIKQYRKHRRKMIIPKIVGKFKMVTSKQINIIRKTPGYVNWQPNYHDHIIRNQQSYVNISRYIINNPSAWDEDEWNTKNR